MKNEVNFAMHFDLNSQLFEAKSTVFCGPLAFISFFKYVSYFNERVLWYLGISFEKTMHIM